MEELPRIDPREQLEASILATLLRRQERLPAVIEHIRPELFQAPLHATIAQAIVEIFRLRGSVEARELVRRLKSQESYLATWLMEQGDVLPDDADLLLLLASQPGRTIAGMHSTPLEKYAAEACQWLWPGRVALGQLTLIGGEAGSGKSLLACDLAARTTTGGVWPDGIGNTAGSVIVVATADDVTALVRPRLEAAGADVRRVRVFPVAADPGPRHAGKGGLALADMLGLLEQAIAELDDCRLVLIDPLQVAAARTPMTSGRETGVRLELLADIARRQQVAVVGIVSPPCSPRRGNDLAQALKTANRASAAWLVSRHPHRKEVRLVAPAKNIRGPDQQTLTFSVDASLGCERLVWQDLVSADELLTGRTCDTVRWLRQALADGPLKAKEILQLGEQNGYTSRMLQYAKPAAGVAVVRDGFGPGAAWHWVLLAPHELAPAQKIA